MGRRENEAFADKVTLEEMLSLRKQGWSYNRLGLKYDRDHTTIIYWCQKMGVSPATHDKIKISRAVITMKQKTIVQSVISPKYKEDKINEGKSYQEYLQEEMKRKYKQYPFLAPKKVAIPIVQI